MGRPVRCSSGKERGDQRKKKTAEKTRRTVGDKEAADAGASNKF
jgi:hypothetical protein